MPAPDPLVQHNAHIATAYAHAHAVAYRVLGSDGLGWFSVHGKGLIDALDAIAPGKPLDDYKAVADDRLKATGVVHDDVHEPAAVDHGGDGGTGPDAAVGG